MLTDREFRRQLGEIAVSPPAVRPESIALPLRDGDEMRAEFAARQYWDQYRAEMADSEFLMLTRESVRRAAVSDLALHVAADHGQYLRAIIRHDLAEDAGALRHVLRLREVEADGHPEATKRLAALDADGTIKRAQRAQHTLALVARAFDTADMMALSAVDLADEGVVPQPPVFRVQHQMMSHPGVRRQLGVHGAIRSTLPRADGHGHNPSADLPEAADGNPVDASGQPGNTPLRPRPGRRDKQLKRRNKKRQPRRRSV
jgi:hypothetical protein